MSQSRLILSPQMAVTFGFSDWQVFGSATTSETITIIDNSVVTLAGDFSRGGDVIRLAGRAQDFSAVRSGSNIVLTSSVDQITVSVPVGVAGTLVAFDDGRGSFGDTRRLLFDGTNVVLGAVPIIVTPTNLPIGSSPTTQPVPDPLPETTSRARLLVASGQSVAVGGGAFDIFGTNRGSETVIAFDNASISLSGDFSRGGDVVRLTGRAGNFTAQLSGSSLVLTSAVDAITARIPIGPAGIKVQFEGSSPESFDERILRFDGRNVTLGDAIVSSAAVSLNSAPVVAAPIADQTAQSGQRWEYQIPNNSFSDRDGDPLVLTARLASGGALPAWLTFDPATRSFIGNVPEGITGNFEIAVSALDGKSMVTDRFVLQVDSASAVVRPVVSDVVPFTEEFTNTNGIFLGQQWGRTGQPLTITFGFPNSAAQYGPGSSYVAQAGSLLDGFRAFTAEEAAAARQALQVWADVANITFVELAPEQAGQAVLRFAVTSTGLPFFTAAQAFSPGSSESAGSSWYKAETWFTPRPGNAPFNTLVHEIGHALVGLSDVSVQAGAGKFPTEFNRYYQSIMSYNQPKLTFARTPMILDVLAAQRIFGTNNNFQAEDTVWSFDIGHIINDGSLPTGKVDELREQKNLVATIWDAGGTDWLDWSNQLLPARLNLTPGTASLMIRPQEWPNLPNFSDIEGNIGIAYGAWIENVRGGPAQDRIIGNNLANLIEGGPGSDTLEGGEGLDTALYTDTQSRYSVSRLQDTFTVEDLITGSVDYLTGIERVQFAGSAPIDLNSLMLRTGVNTAPQAGRDVLVLDGPAASIPLTTLLQNDRDAENDGLRIVGANASGPMSISLNNGTIAISAGPNAKGPAQITYEIRDDRGLTANGVVDVFFNARPERSVVNLSKNVSGGSNAVGPFQFSEATGTIIARTFAALSPLPSEQPGQIVSIDPITQQVFVIDEGAELIWALSANGRFLASSATNAPTTLIDLISKEKFTLPVEGIPFFVANDGKSVGLTSNKSLASSDTDSLTDVFVLDRETGVTRHVVPSLAGDVIVIKTSADGRYWLLDAITDARNERDQPYKVRNLYLYDATADQARLITPTGDAGQSGSLSVSDMSSDGRFVAFWSIHGFDGTQSIGVSGFVYDTQNNTYKRVSIDRGITSWDSITISDDGRFVAFSASTDGIVADDRNGLFDVFVFDTLKGRTEILSIGASGNSLNGDSTSAQFLNGGREIVLVSRASNFTPDDTEKLQDLFIVSNPLFGEINTPPKANDLLVAPSGSPIVVPISNLLNAATDSDGDKLNLISFGSESGARVERVDDNIVVTPTSGSGLWTVDFVLSDGRDGFASAQIKPRLAKLNLFDWSTSVEGSAGQVFAVLSAPSTIDVKFQFRLEGITAELGRDLRALANTVVIPAGQMQARLPIEFINDNLVEGKETFAIFIYEIQGATMFLDSNYGFASGFIADGGVTVG